MSEHRTIRSRFDESMGWRLSKIGEKLGVERLIYNGFTFRHFHRVAEHSAPSVIAAVTDLLPDLASVVDVGAGSGAYAAQFKRAGKRIVACEYNPRGRRMAAEQGVTSVPFDLTAEKPADVTGPFDLAYCFEVAEHLPPAMGDKLVAFMAGLSNRVLFSAAYPGQGGHGHINEQPKEYWVSKFEAHGLRLDAELSERLRAKLTELDSPAWWLAKNAFIVRR